MFDVFYFGPKPNQFAHEQQAHSIEHAQSLSRTEYFWWISYLADYSDFDFVYVPPPWQAEYTHTWPSQHHEYSGTCLVPRLGKIKYHFHDQIIPNRSSQDHYHVFHASYFDFSWAPHPHDPPYVYVFGNQWWPAEKMPMVEYHVPGATERKYMPGPTAILSKNINCCWHDVIPGCDWDHSWVPDPGDPPYIYVFGNQWWPAEKMPTMEYHVPGAAERKYMSWPRATLTPSQEHWTVPDTVEASTFDFSWHPDPGDSKPYMYQFGTQHQKTGGPRYVMPGATETKYIRFPRAIKKSVDQYWTVPSNADVSTFDFSWHPDNTDQPYMYQFGTQHQKTGGPRYVMPGATETKYISQITIKTDSSAVPIFEIDHLDGHAGKIENTTRRVRYFDNYRDTLIRLAKSIGTEHEYVWVCSSICDYAGFDFSWHPEAWQATMLHVFASNDQKFGDTFYMHVPTFADRAESKALLDWYDINYVPGILVPRRSMPVIQHTDDTHVNQVKTTKWDGPLALFTVDQVPVTLPTVSLWRKETKTIVPLSPGASAVIVPRSAQADVRNQLYDYSFINKNERKRHSDQPLDIVFISNGELGAEANWGIVGSAVAYKPNKLHRIDGINGRVAAYHVAARASQTPWFFAVFAKLEVDPKFDWSWQPDRMQQPKHYIFHARNPVNGLEYGHQAMIAYNRQLVLANTGYGLDFTLDSAHEVVPILSGIAKYNHTPWMAWRTAFREVIKLCASSDVESQYRLKQWLATPRTNVENWAWSVWGAEDAVEYYQEVKGEPTELRKSYEWAWLASYAFVRRSLTPDQQ